MLQSGEIQTIVGDASRMGIGGQQYCGLWSLTSVHRPFNAFGNQYAGLIPREMRGREPKFRVDGEHAILERPADKKYPVRSKASYKVVAPYYIDHTLTFTDEEDVRQDGCDFREVSWCSYMNSPEDSRLNFLSDQQWLRYISPSHGVGSNISPSYISEEELEHWPVQSDWRKERLDDRPFHWDRCDFKFDQPFYYGRLGNMALIFVFDNPKWLRFFCSPSGGGKSMINGKFCPAWDHLWVIPKSEYEIGKEFRFRTRLIYKEFVSDEDILKEVNDSLAEFNIN